jgi:O-glycosyl hydrolase
LPETSITIDRTTRYQTIEGFGFFGAANVWWSSPNAVWDKDWAEKAVTDLGITIWRNEFFPPAIPGANQDADWEKQKPVVKGLKATADKHKVDLKFIATVWSPPADLKWEAKMNWVGDKDAVRKEGKVSTKHGGTLNPGKYKEYADWLKSHLQLYKDLGIDIYALSLQNEPAFAQTFNSCTYTSDWYNELLIGVVPKVKAGFPKVKIFGSENMLDQEASDKNWKFFYHSGIKANAEAAKNVDVLAVHGYLDGLAASSGSELDKMWTNHEQQFSAPMKKPAWMTETSGYAESWEKSSGKPGALDLARDMHSALFYGNLSAWVWWQGSQTDLNEFALMSGTTTGKKYSVSKHFYRYVRPGAVRLKSTATDPELAVTAFENAAKKTQTVVIINSGTTDKSVSLAGKGLLGTFKMYRTNSDQENCTFIEDVRPDGKSSFAIPAKTIVTLQGGGDAL